MQQWPPLLNILIGAVFASFLAFAWNVLFRKTGKRAEWFDSGEKRLQDLAYKQDLLERRLGEMDRLLEDLRKLIARVEALEWKIGSWYRLVEEHMTDFLKPRH